MLISLCLIYQKSIYFNTIVFYSSIREIRGDPRPSDKSLFGSGIKIMDTPVIYLNNAATSWPKPPEVIEAVNESFRQPFNEPGRSTSQLPTDYLNTTREAVTGFSGCRIPDHIIFTANATDSLNTLIHGFAMKTPESFQCTS